MATTPSGAGSPPGNLSGIVDLEIDQFDVRPAAVAFLAFWFGIWPCSSFASAIRR
jgi:hypothetical protein